MKPLIVAAAICVAPLAQAVDIYECWVSQGEKHFDNFGQLPGCKRLDVLDVPDEHRQRLLPKDAAARAKQESKLRDASGACLVALQKTLHDPYSARFDHTGTWYAEERKNGTILVQPTGRAKNQFGAYVYGTWSCIARHEGKNVRVLSLKQIRP
jgi:hypothetical protein